LALRDDLDIVYPVHLNPKVKDSVEASLQGYENIYLLDPQDYISFVYLMKRCYLVLTDSGGIQEEAPALGKPVLVMRDSTERPEAIVSGTARLVGVDANKICQHVILLLDDQASYQQMVNSKNPYGNGTAAQNIVVAIKHYFSE
jgi:UDP-N-acetylglucosamine 2-epimerase